MYTIYITEKRELIISDSEGNLLNPHDLKPENKKAKYDLETGKIKILPNKRQQPENIPYDRTLDSFLVSVKLVVPIKQLERAVKERRKELDENWSEYFTACSLVTQYTTIGLQVPDRVREESNRRLNLVKKNNPRTLIQILTS